MQPGPLTPHTSEATWVGSPEELGEQAFFESWEGAGPTQRALSATLGPAPTLSPSSHYGGAGPPPQEPSAPEVTPARGPGAGSDGLCLGQGTGLHTNTPVCRVPPHTEADRGAAEAGVSPPSATAEGAAVGARASPTAPPVPSAALSSSSSQ